MKFPGKKIREKRRFTKPNCALVPKSLGLVHMGPSANLLTVPQSCATWTDIRGIKRKGVILFGRTEAVHMVDDVASFTSKILQLMV